MPPLSRRPILGTDRHPARRSEPERTQSRFSHRPDVGAGTNPISSLAERRLTAGTNPIPIPARAKAHRRNEPNPDSCTSEGSPPERTQSQFLHERRLAAGTNPTSDRNGTGGRGCGFLQSQSSSSPGGRSHPDAQGLHVLPLRPERVRPEAGTNPFAIFTRPRCRRQDEPSRSRSELPAHPVATSLKPGPRSSYNAIRRRVVTQGRAS
jgi:hypothetical protein